MSIQLTVAVVDPVFPASSTKSNTNDPLALKVYVLEPELLVIVIFSLAPVRVATTDPLVVTDGEYSTENIVFKLIRRNNIMGKIKDMLTKAYDRSMTIDE